MGEFNVFDAISMVTSGLTLAAFIGALIAFVIRHRINREKELIEQAPESDRAELIKNALEFFNVDTGNLTKQQQYNIAMEQINSRSRRFTITSIVIVIIAILLLFGTIRALSNSNADTVAAEKATEAADSTEEIKEGLKKGGILPSGEKPLIEQEINGVWGEEGCGVRYEFNLNKSSVTVDELSPPSGVSPIQFLFIDARSEDKITPAGAKQSVMSVTERRGLKPGSSVRFVLTDHGSFQSLLWDSSNPQQGSLELERCGGAQ